MFFVNHGFCGVISQSANTSRGSRPDESSTAVPSGKAAATGPFTAGGAGVPSGSLAVEPSGSQKTCSSFHSRVGLYPTCEKNAAMPESRSGGQFWVRVPMKVWATAVAMPSGVRF